MIWRFFGVLLAAHHSLAAVANDAYPLTGPQDSVPFAATIPPSTGGSSDNLLVASATEPTEDRVDSPPTDAQVLDIPINGAENPQPLVLSKNSQCRRDIYQAPHEQGRRISRKRGEACQSDYTAPLHPGVNSEPATLHIPSNAAPEQPEVGKAPLLPEGLPPADPNLCKDPAHPIPVCHSYLWATANSPYRLPYCHPGLWLSHFPHSRLSYKTSRVGWGRCESHGWLLMKKKKIMTKPAQ